MADVARGANPTPPQTSVLAGATRMFDYWVTVYKRSWKGSVVSSFITPFLYVLAMGVLLGGFIQRDPSQLEGAPSYLAFVAPGLVAAQAMQTVFGEVTYPVMGMIKWHKSYYGMIATPLGVREVILAHLGFVTFRVATTCAVFLAVMAPFGVFASVGGVVAAFLAQLLVGAAFATPLYAFSAGLKDESAFSLIFRLGMIPLFLVSGAFFPIANLSPFLEAVAKVTPLWHGVDLTRMLTLGRVDGSMVLVHLVYLTVLALGGWFAAVHRLQKRMIL